MLPKGRHAQVDTLWCTRTVKCWLYSSISYSYIYIYIFIILSISIDSQFNALLSLLRGPHGSLCYNLFGIEYVRAFGLCLLCLSLQRSTIPKSTLHIWHPWSTYSVNQKIMQQRSIERFKDWIKTEVGNNITSGGKKSKGSSGEKHRKTLRLRFDSSQSGWWCYMVIVIACFWTLSIDHQLTLILASSRFFQGTMSFMDGSLAGHSHDTWAQGLSDIMKTFHSLPLKRKTSNKIVQWFETINQESKYPKVNEPPIQLCIV